VIVSDPPVEFAWPIAQRSVPVVGTPPVNVSATLVTVKVDSSLRSSSAINVGRIRRRFRASTVPRPPLR
jgi:hypothetical protein